MLFDSSILGGNVINKVPNYLKVMIVPLIIYSEE